MEHGQARIRFGTAFWLVRVPRHGTHGFGVAIRSVTYDKMMMRYQIHDRPDVFVCVWPPSAILIRCVAVWYRNITFWMGENEKKKQKRYDNENKNNYWIWLDSGKWNYRSYSITCEVPSLKAVEQERSVISKTGHRNSCLVSCWRVLTNRCRLCPWYVCILDTNKQSSVGLRQQNALRSSGRVVVVHRVGEWRVQNDNVTKKSEYRISKIKHLLELCLDDTWPSSRSVSWDTSVRAPTSDWTAVRLHSWWNLIRTSKVLLLCSRRVPWASLWRVKMMDQCEYEMERSPTNSITRWNGALSEKINQTPKLIRHRSMELFSQQRTSCLTVFPGRALTSRWTEGSMACDIVIVQDKAPPWLYQKRKHLSKHLSGNRNIGGSRVASPPREVWEI